MGSITHITDEAGNLCNHYEYDAFGDFTVKEETVHNRFGYTGEQYDPVAELYYLRARFYNPVIGRFIQEDTYYGDGLNLYSYCQNNPVKYVDPSGHACKNKQEAINILEEHYPLKDVEAEYNKLIEQYGNAADVRKALEKQYGSSRFDSTYNLRPNNEYTINGYTYKTDANGRVVSASGDLRLEDGVRNQTHQLKAGGADRLPDDDGGHLIATIFGGSGKVDNIDAMNYNLNRGAYKSMETMWANLLSENKKVKVDITAIYSGNSMRPERFSIIYWVDGELADPIDFKNVYGGK